MTPRFLAATFAVAVLLGTPAATRADDASKTHELRLHESWKAGTVVTNTATKTTVTRQVVTAGGEAAPAEEGTEVETYRTISKVEAVDERGEATQALVYVAAWSMKEGTEEDTCLQGVHVAVTGVGKDRTWKILTPGKVPSEGAKGWLDENLGKKEHDVARTMEPSKALAVGASWTPDVPGYAATLAEQFDVDVEKSKASGTLTGVEGDVASYTLECAMHTKGLVAGPGESYAWTEGGLLTVRVAARATLGATGTYGSGTTEFTLVGAFSPAPGVSVKLDVKGTEEVASTAGGEIPPLAK